MEGDLLNSCLDSAIDNSIDKVRSISSYIIYDSANISHEKKCLGKTNFDTNGNP